MLPSLLYYLKLQRKTLKKNFFLLYLKGNLKFLIENIIIIIKKKESFCCFISF